LSGTKLDVGILKRAATWSYITGAWLLISVVVLVVAIFAMIVPIAGSITGTSSLSAVSQIFNSIFLAFALVFAITIMITIIFGYYIYKIGGQFNLGSLKLSGVFEMLVGFLFPLVLYGLYTFFNALTSGVLTLTLLTATSYEAYLVSVAGMLILSAAVVGIVGLVALISLIVGSSAMKSRTGVGTFGTAMILMILGIFIGITFPIGIMLFGSALSTTARQERETIAKPGAAQGPRGKAVSRGTIFCPYCGAKVDGDNLFCPSCGSSLKKEG
jgi:hypothetical protein